jgi:hypothetical protein
MQKSSEVPSRRKNASLQKENIQEMERTQEEDYRRMTPPRRSIIQNQQPTWKELKKKITEEKHHSEDLLHPGTKLFFLVYVIPVTILGTRL